MKQVSHVVVLLPYITLKTPDMQPKHALCDYTLERVRIVNKVFQRELKNQLGKTILKAKYPS